MEKKIFDFTKTSFRYVFSIAIMLANNVFLWDCMGKGAYIKRMVAVINYNANSIMEKKQIGEDGGGG